MKWPSTIQCWCASSFLILSVWIPYSIGQAIRLGRMNVDREYISLSGFSSGATFAQQVYISYSSLFCGLAVFSHTYYRCGPPTGVVRDYDNVCTTLGNRNIRDLYDPNNALADIENYYRSGLIENPHNMANKPLYVFAGTKNYLFTADMSLRILQVFEPYINNPNKIRTRVQEANLTLPSNRAGRPRCTDPPNSLAISNCGFSGALDSLQFLLGKKAIRDIKGPLQLQTLLTFDQTEFFFGIEEFGRYDMDTIGFKYIPKGCVNNNQCLLHIYFHGCSTGREFVGADHILNSGFLEVAEVNNIIMIFPQAVSGHGNLGGCWDTYGFTGSLYATQAGAQVTVIRNILSRILGEDEESHHHTIDYNNVPVPTGQPALQWITDPVQKPIEPPTQWIAGINSQKLDSEPGPWIRDPLGRRKALYNDPGPWAPLRDPLRGRKVIPGEPVRYSTQISTRLNRNSGYFPPIDSTRCTISQVNPNTILQRCIT